MEDIVSTKGHEILFDLVDQMIQEIKYKNENVTNYMPYIFSSSFILLGQLFLLKQQCTP